MATLNIRNIDEGLKAEVKAAAAMAQMTLSEFCTMIFRSMKFREVGGRGNGAQDKKNRDGVGPVVGAQSLVDRVGAMVPDPVFGAATDFQPDPVISQNEKQTQKGKLTVEYKKGVPVSKKIATVPAPMPQGGTVTWSAPAAPDFVHDPKTCAVYGCLMCKAIKEGE